MNVEHVGDLVSMIEQSAGTARHNRNQCASNSRSKPESSAVSYGPMGLCSIRSRHWRGCKKPSSVHTCSFVSAASTTEASSAKCSREQMTWTLCFGWHKTRSAAESTSWSLPDNNPFAPFFSIQQFWAVCFLHMILGSLCQYIDSRQTLF